MLLSVKAAWMMMWSVTGQFQGPSEPHAHFDTEAECLRALEAKQAAAYGHTRHSKHLLEERHAPPFDGVVYLWKCHTPDDYDPFGH